MADNLPESKPREEERPMKISDEDVQLGQFPYEPFSDASEFSDEADPMEIKCKNFSMKSLIASYGVCRQVLHEVISKARDADTWINEYSWDEMAVREDEANEFSCQKFASQDASGMKTIQSVTQALIPVLPDDLLSIMSNLNEWKETFANIVYRKYEGTLDGGLERLSRQYPDLMELKVVTASFHFPLPFVPPQEFQFLRYHIAATKCPEVWAILDISMDFFPIETANVAPLRASVRGPSGLLIRENGSSGSQVIWVENVQVYRFPFEKFYPLVLFDSAFSSARWVDALQEKLKHYREKPTIAVDNPIPQHLDKKPFCFLARLMKESLLNSVYTSPMKFQWERFDADVDDAGTARIGIYHRDVPIHQCRDVISNSVAMTRFFVDATPIAVFLYLIEENLSINWNTMVVDKSSMPRTVATLANDDAYFVTLRKKSQNLWHVMDEGLLDDYCSYVISSPVYNNILEAATRGEHVGLKLYSSGFIIVPVGSGGYNADSSLVTIILQPRSPVFNTEMASFIRHVSRMIKSKVRLPEPVTVAPLNALSFNPNPRYCPNRCASNP